jgi:hypothetical protein
MNVASAASQNFAYGGDLIALMEHEALKAVTFARGSLDDSPRLIGSNDSQKL